jgi:glucose-1-phosphate cytidylyltransferase
MKTVLLAGGFGTRLSEETNLKPKPMVEIGGMPILWHIMKIYDSYGYDDFAIALGYKGDVIKEFFLNYKLHKSDMILNLRSRNVRFENDFSEDWNIGLHETGANSMTGGRLYNLKKLFKPGDTFMLTYGDGVSDVDIKKLVEFHKAHGKIATLTAVRPPARFGSISMKDDGHIIEFKEKPQLGEGWINGGFFVLEPKVIDYIEGDSTIWERKPMELLAAEGEMGVFKHTGFWQPMDTLREKIHLEELWASGKAPWKLWT